MTDVPPFRHPIQHQGIKDVQRGCGLTGLYCVQRPVQGQQDVSECFQLPDGTTPDPNYGVRCGACGWDMSIDILRFLHDTFPRLERAEKRLLERVN